MTLIILARDYTQFKRFVDRRFPYLSRLGVDLFCLDSREDMDTASGMGRNQLYLDIGADDPALRDWCEARCHVEITLTGGL